jgi:hypothetical protein
MSQAPAAAPKQSIPAQWSLARLFLEDSPVAYGRAALVWLAVVGVTTIGMFWPGPYYQSAFPNDTGSLLDAGWRVYNGQRPHIDFYSQLGPVPLLMVALGMIMAGPCGSSLYLGYALLFPLVAMWAWALARPRLPALPALVFSALVAFLVIGQRALGAPWNTLSCAMNYNRLGWAVLLLVLLQLMLAPRAPTPRRSFWEGAATGLALAVLIFLKVNYLAAAAGAVILAVILGATGRRTWLGVATGFVPAALAMLAYLRFDIPAILDDARNLAAVQDPADRLTELTLKAWKNALWLAEMAAVTLLLYLSFRGAIADRQRWLSAVTGFVAAALLGLVVCGGNMQLTDIPVFGGALLILCERFRRIMAARVPDGQLAPADQFRYFVACGLAVAMVMMIALQDAASVARSVAFKFRKPGPDELRIGAAPLHDIVYSMPGSTVEGLPMTPTAVLDVDRYELLNAYQYAVCVQDGLTLVRPHVGPDSRILTMDWTNPFSFALGVPGVHGDRYCWHYGRMVNEQHCPPADRLFREVTLVMIPRRALDPFSLKMMRTVYGPVLDRDFAKIDESVLWELYARRPATQ